MFLAVPKAINKRVKTTQDERVNGKSSMVKTQGETSSAYPSQT